MGSGVRRSGQSRHSNRQSTAPGPRSGVGPSSRLRASWPWSWCFPWRSPPRPRRRPGS